VEALTVRTVAPHDAGPAIHTIVLAFASDPVARWTWPNAQQYLEAMPRLALAFGGGAFAHGGAHYTDGFAGVALWLPPGINPDEEALGEVLQSTVSPSHCADVFATFEQMAQYHPQEPHWYLPLIGVDPAHQGKGLGDALMAHVLARCDRERVPAYLESTNPRNVSLYRRHGFEPIGAIQSGSSPILVPMLRRPR
jgi:ribosomal protein S18 acetylase RimI-like enzyme